MPLDSHTITSRDAYTTESHLVYAKENPLEGVGARVDHIDKNDKNALKKMMKAAKVDWTVEAQPLFNSSGTTVPAQGLFRSDNGACLDVVGPSYVPVQNHEAFEFFQDMLDAGNATMESMGQVRNGQYVWAMADLGETVTVGKSDKVKGYVFVGCPHMQGKSLLFKSTSLRITCNNMIAKMIRTGISGRANPRATLSEVRRSHRSVFDKVAMQHAQASLGIARENFQEFGEIANKLHKMGTNNNDAIGILQPVFAPKFEGKMDMDTLTPRMAQLMDILHNAPGAEPATAWGILNAATYYNTHVAGKTNDRRFYQNMMAKGAQTTEAVMELLLA